MFIVKSILCKKKYDGIHYLFPKRMSLHTKLKETCTKKLWVGQVRSSRNHFIHFQTLAIVIYFYIKLKAQGTYYSYVPVLILSIKREYVITIPGVVI